MPAFSPGPAGVRILSSPLFLLLRSELWASACSLYFSAEEVSMRTQPTNTEMIVGLRKNRIQQEWIAVKHCNLYLFYFF